MNSHSDSRFYSLWHFSMFRDFGVYTYGEREIFVNVFSLSVGWERAQGLLPTFFSPYQQFYSCWELLSSRPVTQSHFYYFRAFLAQ